MAYNPTAPFPQVAAAQPYAGNPSAYAAAVRHPGFLSPDEFVRQAAAVNTPEAWHRLKAAWQTNPLRYTDPARWRQLQGALYQNPIARIADTASAGQRPGLWGRIESAATSPFVRDAAMMTGLAYGLGSVGGAFAPEAIGAGTAAGAGAADAGGAAVGAATGGAETAGWADPALAGEFSFGDTAAGIDPFAAAASGGTDLGAGWGSGTLGGAPDYAAAGNIDPFAYGGGATPDYTAAGNINPFDYVGGNQAPNAFDAFMNKYAKYIGAGTSALGKYEQNRILRQEYERALNAAKENRAAALGYAGPENYNKLYGGYLGQFQQAYKPALLNTGEALALGEQSTQQQFAGDVARRNMEGSGLAQVGPQAISAGRNAAYGQAVRDYYTSSAQGAREAAGQTQSEEIGASLGAPVPYVPKGPSTTQDILGATGAGLAGYTDIQAQQNRKTMAQYGMAPYSNYYYAGQGATGEGYYPGYAQPPNYY